MSANDWEEVKRLAADFQRAQLSSGVLRLSEKNCIEIINKLIERKQIDVVFTSDGKEYITPHHLIKEIKDELFVQGGRINLVDLAKALCIDLNVVTIKATEITHSDSSIKIINGQLIDKSYTSTICEEINDKLNQQGLITIGDLTSHYDLPSEFLLSVIEKQIGKTIKGQQDKQDNYLFYTDDFIDRILSTVRGAMLAITKPTSLGTIINISGVQQRLFFTVMDRLLDNKELPGVVTGKKGITGIYVPSIYTKSQNEWIDNFYNQNGYLEFSALTRLGISDPVPFIKRHFSNSDVVMLATCAVGSLIFDQVEAAIDDVISTGSYVNILPLLPSVFDSNDAEIILQQVLKKKSQQKLLTFNSTYVVSEPFMNNLLKAFDGTVEKKVKLMIDSGAVQNFLNLTKTQKNAGDEEKSETKGDKKEERRKKASEGKGGGGTQGRETKTKSTKKKYMKNTQHDSDEDDDDSYNVKNSKQNVKLEIVNFNDVKNVLNKLESLQDEDEVDALIEDLGRYLHPKINEKALATAKTIYEESFANSNQDRRKKHNELQEKLNDLVTKVRLFEKGFKQFTLKDTQQQLAKYLLKTICTDITNDIFTYVSQDSIKIGKEITNEIRLKILNGLPNDVKETLTTLHKSLASATIDDFLNIIDAAVGPGICDIILKKPDKKKERPQLLNHRQQLIEQLNVSEDPALVLHLASLIIFQGVTQTILHASGKFVSSILTFLQPSLPTDVYNSLQRYHDLVLKFLTVSDAEEKSSTQRILEEEMPLIKEIALSYKKAVDKSQQ